MFDPNGTRVISSVAEVCQEPHRGIGLASSHAVFQAAPQGLAVVRVHLDRLRHNWRFLASKAGGAPPMAVVKADAYGHGMVAVARTLLDEGCRFFAAGSVAESIILRNALSTCGGEGVSILSFLGVMSVEDARASSAHGLIPFVHSPEQATFASEAHQGKAPLPVAVKVETGMARLGFRPDQDVEMIALLREKKNLEPRYLVSHLASVDEPGQEASVNQQVDRYTRIFRAMRAIWPGIIPSIANSAAYLLQDTLLPGLLGHVGRPGYALYGGNPFADTNHAHYGEALMPVMEVTAPVLAVHGLAKGESVSYGRTFTAGENMRVAVVGAGYSDGYSRGLSGRGRVCIHGEHCPIIGRVCMQMHMVDVTHAPKVMPGDDAYLLGGSDAGRVSAKELAKAWGTIPYEVFCLLGRNRHIYSDKA